MNLKVSELFASVQGEGPSAGRPAAFLRLAQCNLHCRWCDTKYTWDWRNFRFEDEVRVETVAAIAGEIRALGETRLVVTGGEPLLQQEALGELFEMLDAGPRSLVEVETNGTVRPDAALVRRVDQWNVSPKLANAGDPEHLRLHPDVLRAFARTGRAYLKLVVESEADSDEAATLARALDWPGERVLFMPQARTRDELKVRAPLVSAQALRRGFAVSPRLHVERWDGARGR